MSPVAHDALLIGAAIASLVLTAAGAIWLLIRHTDLGQWP